MRIGFALGGSDLGRSGIGIYVAEVLPRLVARARDRGDRVVVFGTRAEHRAFDTASLRVELSFLPRVFDRPGPSALFHLAMSGPLAALSRVDVLLLPAANRRITLVSPVPTVAVVHDVAQLSVAEKYDPLRMTYVQRIVVPAFRRVGSLVAVSNATQNDLVEALGIPAEDIRVVYNGVDADRFRPRDRRDPEVEAALDTHNISRPYLLYVSRLEHPGKNHLRLVRAFGGSELAKTHDLLLVGADWGAHESIVEEAQRAGIGDRVRWLGFVDAADLPSLVALADAMIMVGLREGFGLPALEAIAAGRPVCASNTGALPEVVGPHGALCDPFDEASITRALEASVADTDLRARVRAEGPAWARARGWQRTADGLYDACLALLDSRPVRHDRPQ
jgi:glycosyltransferase involved in cell wall biosynthesis